MAASRPEPLAPTLTPLTGLWIAGCWIGSARVGSPLPVPTPVCLAFLALVLVLRHRRPSGPRGLLGVAFVTLLAGALAGGAAMQPAPLLKLQDHRLGLDGPWRLRGVIDGDVEPTGTGSVAAVTVTAVRVDGVWRPWGGRIRLRVASTSPGWPGGTSLEGLVRLRQDRPPANPGSDTGLRLRLQGFDARGRLHSWKQLRPVVEAPGRTTALRSRLRAAVGELFPERSPLARALLLGERSDLSSDLTDDLARAGLVHLIAVSGLHVGLMLVAFLVAARLTGMASSTAAALGLVALTLMAVVVVPRAPVRRALVMGALLLVARITGRRVRALDALAVSVLLPTLADPAVTGALDLQLSATATLGILLLPPSPRGLGLLAATLAAQAAVAPLLASRLGVVAVAGLGLNLAAAPLLAAGLTLAALAVGAHVAGTPAGPLLARGGSALLDGVVGLAELGRQVPPLPVRTGGWVGGLAWGLLLATALRGTGRARFLSIVGLIALGSLALRAPAPPRPALVALDVGQGDALLVRHPDGEVLVDAGGYPGIDYDTGAAIVAPALRHLGVRRLQAVAATHPHADHIGGIPAILRRFPTAALWIGSVPVDDPGSREMLDTAGIRNIPVVSTADGPLLAGGCRWRSLDPGLEHRARGAREVDNDASLVLLADCGRRRVLLTGDSGVTAEEAWAAAVPTRSILKVGHHGSDTSTGTALLDAVRPRHALVSVGARNPFGLPRAVVLERLRARGIAVYRTDRDGAVSIHLAGRVRARGLRWRAGAGR